MSRSWPLNFSSKLHGFAKAHDVGFLGACLGLQVLLEGHFDVFFSVHQ